MVRALTAALLCASTMVVAAPVRLTFVDTQAAAVRCLAHMRPMNVAMLVLFMAPPAACAIYEPGRCLVYAPLSGPAQVLGLLALEGPDSLLGHELEHCLGETNFHQAQVWASER